MLRVIEVPGTCVPAGSVLSWPRGAARFRCESRSGPAVGLRGRCRCGGGRRRALDRPMCGSSGRSGSAHCLPRSLHIARTKLAPAPFGYRTSPFASSGEESRGHVGDSTGVVSQRTGWVGVTGAECPSHSSGSDGVVVSRGDARAALRFVARSVTRTPRPAQLAAASANVSPGRRAVPMSTIQALGGRCYCRWA